MKSSGTALDCPFGEGLGVSLQNNAPNNINGTITGGTWKQTPQGTWYVDHDGADDYITFADNEAWNLASGSCYFKIWFLCTVLPTDTRARIFSRYDGTNGFYISFETSGRLKFYWKNSGVDSIYILPVSVYNDGIWHQLICSVDLPNTMAYIHVDKVEIGSYLMVAALADVISDPLYIGGNNIIDSYRGGLTKPSIKTYFPTRANIDDLWEAERASFGR